MSSYPSTKNGDESLHSSLLVKYSGDVWVTTDNAIQAPKSSVMIGNIGDTSNGVKITYSKHLSIINTGVGAYLIDGNNPVKTVIKTPLQTSPNNPIAEIKARHIGDNIVVGALLKDGTFKVYIQKSNKHLQR